MGEGARGQGGGEMMYFPWMFTIFDAKTKYLYTKHMTVLTDSDSCSLSLCENSNLFLEWLGIPFKISLPIVLTLNELCNLYVAGMTLLGMKYKTVGRLCCVTVDCWLKRKMSKQTETNGWLDHDLLLCNT